jgi:hypothetical protein
MEIINNRYFQLLNFKNHKKALLASCVVFFIFLFSECVFTGQVIDPIIYLKAENNSLVGSVKCRQCHEEIYNDYLATAHKNTSSPANSKNVKGSFEEGKNSFVFNFYDGVVMQDLDSGLYQVNFMNRKFDKAYRFDIVVGSATRGQSYLYWNDDRLFQLPISYFTNTDSWSNSPGYADDAAYFGRAIGSQCVGCHASHAEVIPDNKSRFERFDKDNIIYGVNCERCHGPGGNHVELFSKNPNYIGANLIVNAKNLSQRQQLDACGVCHSSITKDLKNALYFKTGDTLYRHASIVNDTSMSLDVHGNQYGLLQQSMCFVKSAKMTCSTCHDPHKQERSDFNVYSQRCMNCHTEKNTDFSNMVAGVSKEVVMQNCIDCHMPNKESKMLNVKLSMDSKNKPAVIRTHLVGIYPSSKKP